MKILKKIYEGVVKYAAAEAYLNYPPAGGPYMRTSDCAMFKLPVQTCIKKMKIPIRLNYVRMEVKKIVKELSIGINY